MSTSDIIAGSDSERRLGRLLSVAVVIVATAAIVAGATIWLMLTDPVTVATAVDTGEITPLVRQLAAVIYDAIINLLDYL